MTTALDSTPKKTDDAPDNVPQRNVAGMLLGVLAWIIGIIFVFPVLWMLLTSFHNEADAATNPPSLFAPLSLEGYANFFGVNTGANGVFSSICSGNLTEALNDALATFTGACESLPPIL